MRPKRWLSCYINSVYIGQPNHTKLITKTRCFIRTVCAKPYILWSYHHHYDSTREDGTTRMCIFQFHPVHQKCIYIWNEDILPIFAKYWRKAHDDGGHCWFDVLVAIRHEILDARKDVAHDDLFSAISWEVLTKIWNKRHQYVLWWKLLAEK